MIRFLDSLLPFFLAVFCSKPQTGVIRSAVVFPLATPRTRTFSTFHIHQNESRGVKKPPGSVFGQGNRRESRFINVGVNSARTGRGRP